MPGLVPWNLRSLWRWWVLHGFGWVWWMVSNGVMNSNVFTRFGFEQIACQQNAMFLADADWKWTWFWLQNSMFLYSRTNCPFSVSNSWCVHPRLCCSSFSSSATRLGGCDLAYLVEHADPLLISWISDLISLVWLTSLCLLIGCCAFIWCHAFISGCWDWREKAEKDSETKFF